MKKVKQMFLKPKEGLLVKDPKTKTALLPEGGWINLTTYWRRRLKKGDVIESKPSVVNAKISSYNKKGDE